MHRVLLTDNIAREAVELLEGYEGIEARATGTLPREELVRVLPDFEAIIVRSPTKLTEDVIAAGKKLRFIGRAGVGVDNIDVAAATTRGILVLNSPAGNTVSTAEHTIAVLLSLARRTPQADRSLRAGRWARGELTGVELFGKTLGIIGLGRIGKEVARRMLAFSMTVVASDPFVTRESAAALGVELIGLDDLYARSHFITVHVPIGAGTERLISDAEIARMRDGVYLVNCARGGVIDEEAVQRALGAGKVAGVGFDVFGVEPPGNHPLFADERSVFTPHLGAATAEAQLRVAVEIARNVADALTRGVIRDAINRPST